MYLQEMKLQLQPPPALALFAMYLLFSLCEWFNKLLLLINCSFLSGFFFTKSIRYEIFNCSNKICTDGKKKVSS